MICESENMKIIAYDTKIYDTIRKRYNFSRTFCRNFI